MKKSLAILVLLMSAAIYGQVDTASIDPQNYKPKEEFKEVNFYDVVRFTDTARFYTYIITPTDTFTAAEWGQLMENYAAGNTGGLDSNEVYTIVIANKYSDLDIDGNENAFTNWDKNAADDLQINDASPGAGTAYSGNKVEALVSSSAAADGDKSATNEIQGLPDVLSEQDTVGNAKIYSTAQFDIESFFQTVIKGGFGLQLLSSSGKVILNGGTGVQVDGPGLDVNGNLTPNKITLQDGYEIDDSTDLGGSAGTDDQTAAEVTVTPSGNLNSTDVQAALQEHQLDIDALAGGAADGVATGATYDSVNERIDVDVASPGNNFSIDVSALARDSDIPAPYTDADIDGNENAFTNWDKNAADDLQINDAAPTSGTTYSGDKIEDLVSAAEAEITGLPIVENLEQLIGYNGRYNQIIWTDPLRGGLFHLSSETIDSGVVFPATNKTGNWTREYDKSQGVNITWFGADPTGAADNSEIFKKLFSINADRIVFPSGNYGVIQESEVTDTLRSTLEIVGMGDVEIRHMGVDSMRAFLVVYQQGGELTLRNLKFNGRNEVARGVVSISPDVPSDLNFFNIHTDSLQMNLGSTITTGEIGLLASGAFRNVVVEGCDFGPLYSNHTEKARHLWVNAIGYPQPMSVKIRNNDFRKITTLTQAIGTTTQEAIAVFGNESQFDTTDGNLIIEANNFYDARSRFIKSQFRNMKVINNLFEMNTEVVPSTGLEAVSSVDHQYGDFYAAHNTFRYNSSAHTVVFRIFNRAENSGMFGRVHVVGNKIISRYDPSAGNSILRVFSIQDENLTAPAYNDISIEHNIVQDSMFQDFLIYRFDSIQDGKTINLNNNVISNINRNLLYLVSSDSSRVTANVTGVLNYGPAVNILNDPIVAKLNNTYNFGFNEVNKNKIWDQTASIGSHTGKYLSLSTANAGTSSAFTGNVNTVNTTVSLYCSGATMTPGGANGHLVSFALSANYGWQMFKVYNQVGELHFRTNINGTWSGWQLISTGSTTSLPAGSITVTPVGNLNSTDGQSAFEELQASIDAVAAGASDGVVTGALYNTATKMFDFTVAAPGSNFSVDFTPTFPDILAYVRTQIDTGGTQTLATIAGNSDNITEGSTNLFMTTSERSKLSTIATGATANQTDAYLLNLTNHTGLLPWANVNHPATFPPAAHGHSINEVDNLQDSITRLTDSILSLHNRVAGYETYLDALRDEVELLKFIPKELTADREMDSTDVFRRLYNETASGITLTITTDLDSQMGVGDQIVLQARGSDIDIVAGTGVTLNGQTPSSETVVSPWASRVLEKTAPNTYMISVN